jgi:uncharacterized membrane protein YphA (DoxX/SURF4 family)
MIDPAVGALLAAALALLFASAAVHKLRDLARFEEVFRSYQVLPETAARLAWLVPVLELTVGAGMLAQGTRAVAGAAGAALLTVYAVAIGVNLRRGRRDLACGCGGPDERRPIAAWMVWRNLLLAGVLAAMLLLPWTARPLEAADALTTGAGAAVAALIYMSVDRLLGRVAPRAAALRELG